MVHRIGRNHENLSANGRPVVDVSLDRWWGGPGANSCHTCNRTGRECPGVQWQPSCFNDAEDCETEGKGKKHWRSRVGNFFACAAQGVGRGHVGRKMMKTVNQIGRNNKKLVESRYKGRCLMQHLMHRASASSSSGVKLSHAWAEMGLSEGKVR